MKNSNIKRFLACLLAVMLLSQTAVLSPAVFADGTEDGEQVTEATPVFKEDTGTVEVIIESNTNTKDALAKALLENYSDLTDDQIANLKWEYECTGYKISDFNHKSGKTAWGSVDGFTNPYKEGLLNVNYHFAALNKQDSGLEFQVRLGGEIRTIKKIDKAEAPFQLLSHEGSIDLVFANVTDLNYAAIEQAIREVLVVSTDENVSINDITVQYNVGANRYHPLDYKVALGSLEFKAFGEGTFDIQLTWPGNAQYKSFKQVIKNVEFKDNRLASSIVYNDNASITYNMEASVMEEAIIKNALNLDASELPEGVSVSDFTIEYETYGWIGGDTVNVKTQDPKWVPIEGDDNILTHYPQMGAGEQKIRVAFNGNAQYKPCEAVEGTLTVNKADVKVTVKNKIMHVKDEMPEDFVTLNPSDPAIDIYTVYAGITSNVTTSVYVQLPARYQLDENVMKVVDYAVEKITGRSFSEILQEGITVGELKEFVNKIAQNADELQPILNAVNIDISSFTKFVEIVTKLPSIADNMRIAFGTPNHAGVYSVFAVTNNSNYNTAVGIGSITLLMQTKDMKINLNEGLTRTITVSQAKALAESGAVATLNHSGSADGIDQTALHYLYSGVQKNLKPYSSTKNFPTEPGRYVVTVVVLGGDYLAAPVTYSFRIVND